MDRKRATLFIFATVCCAALVTPLEIKSNPMIRETARKLMKRCQQMGYLKPDVDQLSALFGGSDVPAVDRNPGSPTTLLSTFVGVLGSVSFDSTPSKLLASLGKTGLRTSNFTTFPRMIENMRNISLSVDKNAAKFILEGSGCYMNAVMAPMSWEALSSGDGENMEASDYEVLLSAAKPMLLANPPNRLDLPKTITAENLKSMMNTLKDVYEPLSEEQRAEVLSWAKEHITQKYFNCTSGKCDVKVKWLSSETLNIIGPYLSSLSASDVELSLHENFCEFILSSQFKLIMDRINEVNPSLAKKLLDKIQLCFGNINTFLEYFNKLGPLACYYDDSSQLITSTMSLTLLSQLSLCNNPSVRKLKERLMRYATANATVASVEIIHSLGTGAKLLPAKLLSSINVSDVVSLVKDQSIEWTKTQKRILMDKYLGETRCKDLSGQELKDLWPAAEGFPSCIFKKIKSQILGDPDVLKNLSRRIRTDQAIAMVQGLSEKMNVTELMEKMPDGLLLAVPLTELKKANITSWDQVTGKIWRLGQAAILAKKMKTAIKHWYRNVGSVLQGITCETIENVADSNVQEMSESITDAQQWLSKVQARCAAQKLFATLESQRADYFKSITEEELSNISTVLLIHLAPEKVMDLPDLVCPVFLDKMKMANLSSLPWHSPSRSALTQRALRCLGTDLSSLTSEDMYKLGPLLCEVPPSQLDLLNPEVLKASLQSMALCQYIPKYHRAALLQLVNKTFGEPSDWSAITMEEMGPLLFLDENTTHALPKKAWMKDVMSFLIQRSENASEKLRHTLFNVTVFDLAPNGGRKKREANPNSNGNGNNKPGESASNSTGSSTIDADVPTVELIRELGMQNVYWTSQQLEGMSKETFIETVEILGGVTDYTPAQLAVLSKKASQAWGSVENLNESLVAQLGCIAQGFSNDQLMKLAFSLSALEDIAPCGWNSSQISAVWRGVAKHNSLSAEQLEASDMVALNRFICGLNSSEIQQLNSSAFTNAVAFIDGIACSAEVAQHFSDLTISVFGNPSSWSEGQVSDLGTFIAGLDASEFASLDISVFPFISKNSIPLIPPENLAALTVAKLEALGPDNAAMVTSEQRAALSEEQLAAIERAITGSREQATQDGGNSGAPSLSVEGICASTKPLLFFLLGLMLL